MIANVGTTFSVASLAKFLKNEQRTVALETILNYIKYCSDAYLFYQVKREDLEESIDQQLVLRKIVRRYGSFAK